MKDIKDKLSEEELNLLIKLNLDTVEDLLDLEDALAEYMQIHCLTNNDDLNDEGIICESILNKIGELE